MKTKTIDPQKVNIGVIYVILAAISWGLLGIFVRALNQAGFEAIQIVAIRAIGASVLLFLYLLIKDRQALKIRLKDLWVFLGTGIGSMVFFNFCYFGCINRTSLAVAAALLYTAPAFVAVLAGLCFREKVTGQGLLAIIMAIFGCMLTSGIMTHPGNIDGAGLLLGLGAGLGYALYSIFGKFAILRGYRSTTITFYTFLLAMLSTSFSLIDGRKVSDVQWRSPQFTGSVVCLVLISTIAAYLLYTKGIETIPAGTASVLASVEPVVATMISLLLFKETIFPDTFAGICFIILSAILSCEKKET